MLEAAEALFAAKGYFGASMRDITQAAGVPLGLSNYHFRSKDELYREVLMRRVPALSASLDEALGRAAQDAQAIFQGYVQAHLERLTSDDPGWRSYIRLAAISTLQPISRDVTEPIAHAYAPVFDRYRRALTRTAPRIGARALDRTFYIFQMGVLAICADIRWQTDAHDFDPEEIGAMLARNAALGLQASAAE
jgi:AcrR family transcriptional regulator